MTQARDYLTQENERNKAFAPLYTAMVKLAFGADEAVIVGHHVAFIDPSGDLNSEREIPSADALLFDHTIMRAVFGDDALEIMREAATIPADTYERDAFITRCFKNKGYVLPPHTV